MRLFSKAKDGGPESPVDGYFLIEIKSLFSIVLLHFNFGRRESFHNHAFNALTFWLKGNVTEEIEEYWPGKHVRRDTWRAGDVKYTPRDTMHRFETPSTGTYKSFFGNIVARAHKNGAWALSFRGPWKKTWQEHKTPFGESITLTNGRKLVTE